MKSYSNYKISHPLYGIWWATSIYGCAKAIGCHQSLIYNNRQRNTFKGWTIERTMQDFSDIPSKYINPDKEFILKFHNDFLMDMEAMNGDDGIIKKVEVEKNYGDKIDTHFILNEVKQIIDNKDKEEWLIKKFAFDYGIKNQKSIKSLAE
jgi:hypothetical protein